LQAGSSPVSEEQSPGICQTTVNDRALLTAITCISEGAPDWSIEMSLKNEWQLMGNIGQDPEISETANGLMAKFSLAVERPVLKNGNWETETEWHDLVAFGKSAEMVQRRLAKGTVVKGSRIIASGEIRSKKRTVEGRTQKFVDLAIQEIEVLIVARDSVRQQPAQSMQQPAQPMQQPAQPMQQPAQPVQPPAQPMQQPAQPMQQPAQPMQQPAQPMQQPAQPSTPPAQGGGVNAEGFYEPNLRF
jgi:single stranded DNA-binding protein